MKIEVSNPVLATIRAQAPLTPLTVGVLGSGIVGQGLRLPDHLLDHPFFKEMPLGGLPVPTDGAVQISEELQEVFLAVADLCGANAPPDVVGPFSRLTEAFQEDRATIDFVKVGINAGDLLSTMLHEVKPLSVTLNIVKLGTALIGIWRKVTG